MASVAVMTVCTCQRRRSGMPHIGEVITNAASDSDNSSNREGAEAESRDYPAVHGVYLCAINRLDAGQPVNRQQQCTARSYTGLFVQIHAKAPERPVPETPYRYRNNKCHHHEMDKEIPSSRHPERVASKRAEAPWLLPDHSANQLVDHTM